MSDMTFDLGTYTQVPVTAVDTDADGNLVTGVSTVFSAPDATVVTLEQQDDGSTVVVRATRDAGTVVITGTVTNADGTTASGTLTITLGAIVPPVADVADVKLVPGTPS